MTANDARWDGVAIIGAGLAGLGCALELPGARVFEANAHPGGHAFSHDLGGVPFDEGAHISHTKDLDFLALICAQAGDVHRVEPSIVRNYWNGHWTGYPIQNHLRDLPVEMRIDALTDLVSAQLKYDGPEGATYQDWLTRQYGAFLTDRFYEVFTQKYWRRSTDQLSTDWLGGRLLPSDLENIIAGAFGGAVRPQASFNTFHYPATGGFFSFFAALYNDLSISYEHRVVEVDLSAKELLFDSGSSEAFEVLASSMPLPDLVNAITSVPSSVRDAADSLHHTKLLCVNLVVGQPDLTEAHWCYVYDLDIPPSRLSFPGNLAPGSVPPGKSAIQAEVFRDNRETWNIDALAEETIEKVARLLGFDSALVVQTGLVEVPHAYVVSDHARRDAVDHICDWLAERGVHTFGLYGGWNYLWSDAAFASGRAVAEAIRANA